MRGWWRRRFGNKSRRYFTPYSPLLAFKVGDEGISCDEYAALFMKDSVAPTSVLADNIPLSQDTLFSQHLITTLAHT